MGRRIPSFVITAVLALALSAPSGQRRHRRHHRPQRSHPPRVSTPAGRRGPATPNRRKSRRLARSPRRTNSSTPPAPIPTGASPSSSSRTNRPAKAPVGELKTVRVELPVGLSVNPGATPRCSQAQFEADTCPVGSKVGESLVTAADPLIGTEIEPEPGVTQVPVYNVRPSQGEAARFGLNWPATKSSSKATSPGRATTTRASRSTCRKLCRKRWKNCSRTAGQKRPDPQKPPGLRRPLRRRHLPHHPDHLFRTGLRR